MAYSDPRPPLRTYSRRTPREILEPPSKKRRLEEPIAIEVSSDTSESVVQVKRKISDFFRPPLPSSSPTSIASTIFSASSGRDDSPPSTPPPESSPPPAVKPRVRRRLTTRPTLKMEYYTSEAHNRRKQYSASLRNFAIEGGLKAGVDPAILGTGPSFLSSPEYTLTHTQAARSNDDPLRLFESGKLTVGSRADVSDGQTNRLGDTLRPLPRTDLTRQVRDDGDDIDGTNTLNENSKSIDVPGAKVADQVEERQLPASRSRRLAQTHLDLGQKVFITCKNCDLSYNLNVGQDRKLHHERHDAWMYGLPIRNCHNNKYLKTKKLGLVIHPDGTEDYIVEVTVHCHESWKRLALDALSEVVDPELGTDTYPEDKLFMMFPDPTPEIPSNVASYRHTNELVHSTTNTKRNLVARFNVFLYIKNTRVVSLLLLERITSGFLNNVADNTPINISGIAAQVEAQRVKSEGLHIMPAELGVNKIWTHRNYRRQGLATKLLDCARSEYTYLTLALDKERVAWTQTTADGAALAKRYAGDKPYLSYREARNWFEN